MNLSSECLPVLLVVILWLAGIALRYWVLRHPEANSKYDLTTWATILTGAAEQLYTHNEDKFRYVMQGMAQKFPGLTEADLSAALEWAVHEMGLAHDAAEVKRLNRHATPKSMPMPDTDLLG